MKKVGNIQNAALGEHRIRELNDEINDLIKEKKEYEARIRKLGGPDYREEQDQFELDGQEVPGSDDYRYYGASKNLPHVTEVLQKEVPPPPAKNV